MTMSILAMAISEKIQVGSTLLGLKDKLYLDFGLDINRLVWKKEDDNTDKEINRNLIIRAVFTTERLPIVRC